jgi:hypothetical protein
MLRRLLTGAGIRGPRAWKVARILASERCVYTTQMPCKIPQLWLTYMQLSAQLKTRLSYAMTKVQNGWEKQSLEELEDMTSQRGSPVSAPGRSDGTQPSFDSPRSVDRRRRPSGVSENSDQAMMSPGQSSPSEVSRSLATTPSCKSPTPETFIMLTIY